MKVSLLSSEHYIILLVLSVVITTDHFVLLFYVLDQPSPCNSLCRYVQGLIHQSKTSYCRVFCLRACLVPQLCPTVFCDPMDCSPPGSSVHGILQVRIWSGLAFPPPVGLLNPGIEPESPASLALQGRFFTTEPPGKPQGLGFLRW